MGTTHVHNLIVFISGSSSISKSKMSSTVATHGSTRREDSQRWAWVVWPLYKHLAQSSHSQQR
jgi:hypothetical protein